MCRSKKPLMLAFREVIACTLTVEKGGGKGDLRSAKAGFKVNGWNRKS